MQDSPKAGMEVESVALAGQCSGRSRGVRLMVKACCGVLIALSLYGCVDFLAPKPSIPPTLTREERLSMALGAFLKNQCEKQWALVWPLAREGDGEALAVLANELYSNGLVLPDSDRETTPREKQLANALVVAIYAATAPKYTNKRQVREIFESVAKSSNFKVVSLDSGSISYRPMTPPPAASMTKLEHCLTEANSSAAGDKCVQQAMDLGLIPSFSEYRAAVDEILATNRPKRCFLRVW